MIVAALLCSCSKKPNLQERQDNKVSSGGWAMTGSISFRYAVYILPGGGKDPSVVLREELTEKYSQFKRVEQIPKDPQEMVVCAFLQKDVRTRYAPPNLKSLQYFGYGLSGDQAQALQRAEKALILDFAHPKRHVWAALKTANSLVEDIARRTGGLVWDAETRQVFTPDAWHEKRLALWVEEIPDVSSQTVIHIYNDGEYERAITLGMIKVGLPDVFVEDVSWSSEGDAGKLINVFCQAISEGAPFTAAGVFKLDLSAIKNSKVPDAQRKSLKANAAGQACLSLKQGKGEEGDPENRLIQITPDKYSGPDVHAKQADLLDSFFGWDDAINYVHHNDEVLAASRKARAELPKLHSAFDAGLRPGEFIQVKAPFETPDEGKEWMWVEITGWKGSKIKGLLENEPANVPNLHTGQMVEVQQEEVFDYIRTYPDKHTEGNTTGEIIRKMVEGDGNKPTPGRSQQPVAVDCGS
jgi:uncharacterized protein YegJ (DUF2314 family)